MISDLAFDFGRRLSAPVLEKLLDLPEPVTAEVAIRRDISVPMPDGVTLSADHYRPPGEDPLPVVLFRTPYGKQTVFSQIWAILLARQGFQAIVQDTRGRFASGGRFDAFRQERADGLCTVEWIRAQPWCDGTLATAGPSYLGHTQWAIAPYLDEPLAAMCPAVTTTDFTETFYPGGAFNLHNLLSWSAALGTQHRSLIATLLAQSAHTKRVDEAMTHLPLADADNAAVGKPEPFWRTVTDHAEPGDDFWDEINHRPGLATLTTPVSMVTGWWDLLLDGQLRDFSVLQEHGRTRRITIGPWDHRGSIRATITDSFSWLAAHLHGDASAANRSTVRLYLQKAGQWLDFDQWPPAQSAPTELFLHPGRTLDWQAPQEDSTESFEYDPADPTPTAGGSLLEARLAGQRDNTGIEQRPDVLVFSSAPLPGDVDLIGPVSATIHVGLDTGSGDLFVRLCDVDRKGVSRNVTDGIVRLRGHRGASAVTIQLHPTGYRFGRGHRLRVQISGGAFPNHARNNGTGEPLATAKSTAPIGYRVLLGPGHPSSLTLPVMTAR